MQTEPKSSVETLRWRDGKLEMIDQRVLPAVFEYIAYDSAASVAEGIRSMVVRGAPAIGVAAAYGVALEALRLRGESADGFALGMERGFMVLAETIGHDYDLEYGTDRIEIHTDAIAPGGTAEAVASLIKKIGGEFEGDVRIRA